MAEQPMAADDTDGDAPANAGTAVLGDRFIIDGSKPLPELDSPNAKAYLAEDRRDLSRQLFALVCIPGMPVRTRAMRLLKNLPGTGTLELVEWNTAFWPILGRRTMIIVMERPLGGRVLEQLQSGAVRLTEYDIPRRVVQPIYEGLKHLNSVGVAHRAVRPDNLFFADRERQEIVLGDCFTSPPGFDQPLVFEPLERSMANQAGRGHGSVVDDMFALGASMVVLTLGHNPIEKMKADDLLFRRTNLGSYAAICGNARVPMSLLEPLRGLLSDIPQERWGLTEVELWLNGRKQTPLQKKAAKKADTPYRFSGRDHLNIRTLAHAFNRNIPEAVKTLREETFHAWLKRAVDGGALSETLKGYVDTADFHKDNFQGSEEYLVARVVASMDPIGPMRYKGMSLCLDGFGPMLASEMIRDGNVQVLAEIINRDIYQFWVGERSVVLDSLERAQELAQIKAWLVINDPGYGVERCLYESNHGINCQSDLVVDDCVIVIEDLLPALDAAANHVEGRARPMDRHITAFIAARFNEDIHPHLRALASTKESNAVVGMLSLLAFLQWKLRVQPLYGLASWVGGVLGPAINSFHSRTTRREIEREIPKLVRKGSLPELFDLVDNAEKRLEDQDGYADAVDEYIVCATEIGEIEEAGSELTDKAITTGQKTAAMISLVTTMIVVTITFIAEVL